MHCRDPSNTFEIQAVSKLTAEGLVAQALSSAEVNSVKEILRQKNLDAVLQSVSDNALHLMASGQAPVSAGQTRKCGKPALTFGSLMVSK